MRALMPSAAKPLALCCLLAVLAAAFGPVFVRGDGDSSSSCNSRRLTKERIVDWHETLYATTNVLGAPGAGSSGLRGWAMMVLAMFDAANLASDRKFASYLDLSQLPSNLDDDDSNPFAAAIAAAHAVLDGLIPSTVAPSVRQMLLYSHYARFAVHLGALPQSRRVLNGLALGAYVGQRMLANRTGDGHPPNHCNSWPNPATPACPLSIPNGPQWDRYQYNLPYFPGAPFSPGYTQVRPFGISGYTDPAFSVPDQLPRDSAQFADEWNELFHYGTSNASLSWRTAETDAVARFHDGNFGSQIGWVMDVLSSTDIDLDGVDLLRVLSLAAISSHDAHATHWYYKYLYLMARPISAYRLVPADQAARLPSDPAFTPVLTTSQTPEYPSGHAARTGGVTESFKRAFGDVPPGGSFRSLSYSDSQQGFRTYTSFSQFQQEVQLSRTWGGVHWRNSGVQGRSIAVRVTDYVWSRYLKRRDRHHDDD